MTRRRARLVLILSSLAAVGLAAAVMLFALRDNISFFYSPSDLAARHVGPDRLIRIGGLVAQGSVERPGGLEVRFTVTDLAESLPVTYSGALPDLFREGQGVVAQGRLGEDGVFRADTVLARHDEKYMPPEVAAALKKAGRWQETGGARPAGN
ncbi:MAG: cytochrome c maturation protein CcmE [Alphaproteobacteria bacterium]|nr:cytochrome c maturation protein CcmE [Alphaproteobacteria bacterium]